MSRRKQSNPKPLKVDEEGGGNEAPAPQPPEDKDQTTRGSQDEAATNSTKCDETGMRTSPGSTKGCDLGKGIRIRSDRELISHDGDGCPNGEGGTEESDDQVTDRVRIQCADLRQRPEDELSQDEDSQESASAFTNQQMLAASAGFPYLQHLNNLNFALRNDAARLFYAGLPPDLIPSTVIGAGAGTTNGGVSSRSGEPSTGRGSSSKSTVDGKGASASPSSTADLSPRAGSVYMCEPCNIKFSSANTLEAHQTFYCSFRKDTDKNEAKSEKIVLLPEMEIQKSCSTAGNVGVKRSASSLGSDEVDGGSDDECQLSIDESQGAQKATTETELMEDPLNPNKSLKTGKQYACMFCSYSAEKKVSLNRHMRMHSGGTSATNANAPSTTTLLSEDSRSCSTPFKTQEPGTSVGSNSAGGVVAMECYCKDCDIQFSKVKTYRVHKQYYCSTRHVLKGQAIGSLPSVNTTTLGAGGAPSPSASPAITPNVRQSSSRNSPSASCSPPAVAGSGASLTSSPFLLLPTNPVIIVPYCFIQAATLLPGHMLPTQNALVVLPNGVVQGLPNTLVLPPPPTSSTPGPSGSGSSPNLTNQQQFSLNLPQFMFDDPKEVIKRMSGGSERSRKRHHASSDHLTKEASVGHHRRDAMDLTLRPGSADGAMGKGGSISSLSSGSRSSSHAHLPHPDNQEQFDQSSRSPEQMNCGSGNIADLKPLRTGSMHSSRPSSASVSSTGSASPPAVAIPNQCQAESPDNNTPLPVNGMKLERRSPSTFSQLSESQQQLLFYQHQIQQQQAAAAKMLHTHSSSRGSHKSKSSISSNHSSGIATTFPGGAVLTATNTTQGGRASTSLAELLMASASGGSDPSDSMSKLLSGSNAAAMMAAAAASLPPELAIRLLSDPTYLSSIQQTIAAQQGMMMPTSINSGGHSGSGSSKTTSSPAGGGGTPQVPVKRGVSRCVECDIVFYKYENYLVHKEHYCAARGNNNNGSSLPGGSTGGVINGGSSEDQLHISPPPQLPPPATRQRRSHVGGGGKLNSQFNTRTRNNQARGNTHEEMIMTHSPGDSNSGDGIRTSSQSGSSPSVSLPGVTITPATGPIPQYACIHCGVKFSSLDTLKTHQTFYCPNSVAKQPPPPIPDTVDGEGELESVGVQQSQTKANSNKSLVHDKNGIVTCSKCKLVIPEDQLSVHGAICTHSNTNVAASGSTSAAANPGWKCPCCDTYSPTMSSAQKHLETHSGLRAFKCVLCGYRGNTIRGMRTHIRMHFDKRVSNDLHEADYITCITSKDLEPTGPQNHAPVPNNTTALKMANSNSNFQHKNSGSPPLAGNGGTAIVVKNVNNNDTTPAGVGQEDGGVGLPAAAGGHHVTTTKSTMLYVT